MALDEETGGTSETVDTSRDDVAAAFDKHEAAAVETAAPQQPPAVEPKPGDESATSGRDATGRFTPKRVTGPPPTPESIAAAAPENVAAATPAAPGDPAPVTRHAKAPASWKPEESAHWDKTPGEVRDAVMRREVEVNRALQDTAQARHGLAALQDTVAPYIQNINAANGGDVVGAIKTFFDYDNRLRHGTQIEKARAVTALIRGYGIDIGTLDSELAGAPHDPNRVNQDAVQQAVQAQLAPMREYMERQRQQESYQQQEVARQVDAGVTTFSEAPEHKHYDSVRHDMADILDAATARGQQMTLNEAYERACWQSPKIRSMLITEQASAGAQTQTQAAQRARSAAVGVRNAPRAGAPTSAIPADKRTRADDIAAAFAAHAGDE